MPIGSRDDGFSCAKRISQRSRCALGFVEIGSDVKVRRSDKLSEFLQLHKAVVENDVALQAVFPDDRFERMPVGFAPCAQLVGVSGTQQYVDDVGKLVNDIRESVEHVLNP